MTCMSKSLDSTSKMSEKHVYRAAGSMRRLHIPKMEQIHSDFLDLAKLVSPLLNHLISFHTTGNTKIDAFSARNFFILSRGNRFRRLLGGNIPEQYMKWQQSRVVSIWRLLFFVRSKTGTTKDMLRKHAKHLISFNVHWLS